MNWPHAQAHCVTPFSENRFWPTSLKTRSLTYRPGGPPTMAATPSAYRAGPTRRYCVLALPQSGWRALFPLPSNVRTAIDIAALGSTGCATRMIVQRTSA